MSKNINLSKRLQVIASYLPKNAFFADIGTDHAYLPAYVCLQDEEATAIAGDVVEGPYQAAKNTIERYGLTHRVDVRLGSGLDVIKGEDIKQVVIAGMGGGLIVSILDEGKAYLNTVDKLIIQPNVAARRVRSWLYENSYEITAESIISENDHIYEIIVADKINSGSENNIVEATDKNIIFGPHLLKNKNSHFINKWQDEKEKLKNILTSYQKATVKDDNKIKRMSDEINLIKEVLSDE